MRKEKKKKKRIIRNDYYLNLDARRPFLMNQQCGHDDEAARVSCQNFSHLLALIGIKTEAYFVCKNVY
jgi:hypothetical protein